VEAVVAGIAVVAASIVAVAGIMGMFALVARVALGIRREDRLRTLTSSAPCSASRTARRWTGMGARWA
jgi:hypothetical protein